MLHIQMKKFVEMALQQCTNCLVCYSPEIFDIIIFPIRQTKMGIEITAVAFCEDCLNQNDKETLAKHVMARINALRGEKPEMTLIDETGNVTGILLPDGEIVTVQ
jgi:hypothetical protein